ncbi:peptidase U32 family protein [Candidatus Epulonipiscium viviparus]|uniref:peptidase U32 family protein n=1 Tax=Candidatus Epulonipiscium viviparus TaxID=420336 RepID=UPI0027380B8A|nr:U32 family peptidase [Candidatus Epulopiscium viviparus]
MIELLAPAGSMETLIAAVEYGADAIYMGGGSYGLRAKAKNFTSEEMVTAIEYAHARGVKVYITANIFAHNSDFAHLEDFFKFIERAGADAIIVADPGVFSVAKKTVPNLEIHISTQANNTNYHSANFWIEQGASRIVVARELSFTEIREIYEYIPKDIPIEAFVHGAMCMAYSGRCLLSNYLAKRDANHGECAQPCRWNYNVVEEKRPNEYMPVEEDERGTYIYNSRDLCMIEYLPELVAAGIQSFKIEGRMKTPLYVATVTKAYREAIDTYLKSPEEYEKKKAYFLEEVGKASHREFTTGFYHHKTTENDQTYTHNSYVRNYEFSGILVDFDKENKIATIEQRRKFSIGDTLEILLPNEPFRTFTIDTMTDEDGVVVESAPHPQQHIKVKLDFDITAPAIFRKLDTIEYK